MCGIVGFYSLNNNCTKEEMNNCISNMSLAINHRGPDSYGCWIDEHEGVALGHRRLSIVDLTSNGHQPMHSSSERYVITFNGEIYNYIEICNELKVLGHSFRGSSDTEVMLAAIDMWGLLKAIQKFVGMFAFVLWDKHEKILHLVRDRFGEKPIYYGWMGSTFMFGSELKALKTHKDFLMEIDRDALALYLRHNYVPSPYSIYKSVYKLPPGNILTINTKNNSETSPKPYWSLYSVAQEGQSNLFRGSIAEASEELEKIINKTINQQMIADVPVGAFLSGGVDSSTIVALMQAQSTNRIKTFSIGFNEANYNEAEYAKSVAKHIGTDHSELYVTSQQAMDVIPKLPTLYDEPFGDSSQIPTYLVSEFAKKHVTVSLSGDAGDELFAGYNRYFWGRRIWNNIGWIPSIIRGSGSKVITSISPQIWDRTIGALNSIIPKRSFPKHPGDKIHKLAEILDVKSPEELYHRLISHWKNPNLVALHANEFNKVTTMQANDTVEFENFTKKMMFIDSIGYLPDDILVKLDRASMGVGLESRVPFLDHRLVEFAWTLPLSFNIHSGQGKWMLRQILYKYVPRHLIERPKMGFGVPIDVWLRGPLKEWAEELLDEKRLMREGFFNPGPILRKWKEHKSGVRNWQYHLWDILMFQAWLEKNKSY